MQVRPVTGIPRARYRVVIRFAFWLLRWTFISIGAVAAASVLFAQLYSVNEEFYDPAQFAIGVAGLSKNSDTLKLAGERGFIPMSLNLNPAYVGSHWDSVEAGAAKTGRKPSRRDWRLVREVFVADTDEEAWKLSTGDMMGRMMGEYFLPLLGHFGFKDYLKHAPDVPDSDVTVEYCARRNWIVGSPATVTEKIEKIYREVGGFGVLCVFGFDYKHKPEAWRRSLELLKTEVMPRLKHLGAEFEKAA